MSAHLVTVRELQREGVLDRLSERTDRSAGPSGCWPWTWATSHGYGRLRVFGRPMYAHRLAYLLAHGPIPVGMLVCHHCDNPPCVNPAHLFLGTDSDNQQDKVAKGRQWRRVHRPTVAAAVREGLPIAVAADSFGVSRRTVYRCLQEGAA